MRTTLAIDDDALFAAKALAEHQNRSVGQVVSDLIRKGLDRPEPATYKNGILQVPARPGVIVTLEHVNALRDEAP